MQDAIERRSSINVVISVSNADDDVFFEDDHQALTSRNSFDFNTSTHVPKRIKAQSAPQNDNVLSSRWDSPVAFFALAESARNTHLPENTGQMESSSLTQHELAVPASLRDTQNFKRTSEAILEQHPRNLLNLSITPHNDIQSLPLALNPELRFKDGHIPVLYKENNLVNLKIMKKREESLQSNGSLFIEDYLPSSPAYTGLLLVALEDNKWALSDGTNQFKPEAGISYAFVTMPDKTIRIKDAVQKAHLHLSNNSPAVRYAGNVIFDDNAEINTWDNSSGAFKPSADLKHQAGFHANDLAKYRPHRSVNEPIKSNIAVATEFPVTFALAR